MHAMSRGKDIWNSNFSEAHTEQAVRDAKAALYRAGTRANGEQRAHAQVVQPLVQGGGAAFWACRRACFDDEGSNKRCLTIFSTRRTARRIPSYQITILLPQHSHRAEQHVSKQLLIGRPRRPSLAARRAALALAVPRESRASARPSAPATRTSVPSITRVGLRIVARLRLQAPAVGGGVRAVWRVCRPLGRAR